MVGQSWVIELEEDFQAFVNEFSRTLGNLFCKFLEAFCAGMCWITKYDAMVHWQYKLLCPNDSFINVIHLTNQKCQVAPQSDERGLKDGEEKGSFFN